MVLDTLMCGNMGLVIGDAKRYYITTYGKAGPGAASRKSLCSKDLQQTKIF